MQIEGMRIKDSQMQEYIEELEGASCRKETKKLIARGSDDKFEEQFREMFGDCTLEELRFRMEVGISKCLSGF